MSMTAEQLFEAVRPHLPETYSIRFDPTLCLFVAQSPGHINYSKCPIEMVNTLLGRAQYQPGTADPNRERNIHGAIEDYETSFLHFEGPFPFPASFPERVRQFHEKLWEEGFRVAPLFVARSVGSEIAVQRFPHVGPGNVARFDLENTVMLWDLQGWLTVYARGKYRANDGAWSDVYVPHYFPSIPAAGYRITEFFHWSLPPVISRTGLDAMSLP